MNWFHLSRNLVTLASVICYLQSTLIKCISRGEHLLLSSIGASLGRQHDLIGSENQELRSCGIVIKDSKAYKTYLGFATGKATPKKARKFKKVASPSRKLSPVLEEEHAMKPKRAKKPAKKSTTVPKAGVVIRDTPSESVSKKKTPAKVDKGKCMDLLSGDGVGSQPNVPDEQEDKTTGTDEGTGTKPGVPDVPKYLSESENES
ncbi:hypothetical protein Tco_0631275 [Tanacetum coccineum]